jgi:hypothetical protein
MDRHFETPEQPVAHMREVAVKRSGFSNWLGVEPVKHARASPNTPSTTALRPSCGRPDLMQP